MADLPRMTGGLHAGAADAPLEGAFSKTRARLRRALRVIGRWKIIIFSIFAVTLVVGLLITVLMSSQFTAVSRVEVRPGHKKVVNAQGAVVETTAEDTDFYNTQFYLLKARSLAERVARTMNLAQNPDFFRAHGDSFPGKVQRPAPAQLADRESLAIALLEQHVEVVPVKDSALIDVRYTSRSPQWAADIANAWVRQFIGAGMDRRSALTADARMSLETRLNDLRRRIEESEQNAALYASRAGIDPLKAAPAQRLASRDLLAVSDALQRTEVKRAAAANRAKIIGSKAATSSALSALRARRAEVAAEYARLSVQFKPAYPPLAALGQQLRSLDHGIAQEERRARAALASEQLATARLARELQGEAGSLKARVDMQNHDSIQYEIYRRDAETNRQLYDSALQRYKQLSAAVLGATDVVIVDSAVVPDKPSSPRLIRNMAFALLAATILSGLIVSILDRRDEGIKDPADLEALLDIPLLGAVRDLPADAVQAILTDPRGPGPAPYPKIWSKLVSLDAGYPPSALMVASVQPGEGASTTALVLALTAARSGKKVVLVDADMRSPSLHQYLGARNASGLSNYLAGEEDWRSLLQPLKTEGVTLLAAGPVPPSPADLLSGERFPALAGELAQAFDLVLFDTPPMLDIDDAPLVARGVTRVVFVMEAGRSGIRAIRAALDRLRAADATIMGGVVTKLGDQNADYQYDKR